MTGNPALVAHISDTIRARGPMPFAWFMEQALYRPQHGYYTSGGAKIGRGGDYFTSVSVGPLFGRLMAAQFKEIWEQLGRPNEFTIVEQGAHSGDFARDVRAAGLPQEIRYIAVERFSEEVQPFCGIHFSNELIDSFPVHLVIWTGTEWLERHVDVTENGFVFVNLPLSSAELADRVGKIPLPLPVDYETEVSLHALRWIEAVAEKLKRGHVMAVDYGFPRDEFYAPHRTRGTLQCYSHHKVVADPLTHVGEIDITAHVEWTSLIEHAETCGLQLVGFTDQHHFVTGLLTEELAQDRSAARALQTLMHPGFLGMKFQFLVLAKNVAPDAQLSGLRFARRATNPEASQPVAGG